MAIQEIIVAVLFAGAAVYLGRMVYRNFRPKTGKGCGSNCGCSGENALKKT